MNEFSFLLLEKTQSVTQTYIPNKFLSLLPPEIWKCILFHCSLTKKDFSQLRLTCRFFRNLLCYPLWKQWVPIEELINQKSKVQFCSCHFLKQCLATTAATLLGGSTNVPINQIQPKQQNQPRIEYFGCYFPDTFFPPKNEILIFRDYLPSHLQSLDLSGYKFMDHLDWKNIPSSLTELNLTETSPPENCFSHLPVSLTCLILIKNYDLNEFCMAYLKGLTRLKELNLTWCVKVSNSSYQFLPSQLEILHLCWCPQLNLEGLSNLPGQLKHLDLSFNKHLQDDWIKGLPPKLQSLNCSSCDSLSDCMLSYLPSTLKHLNLETCENITDKGLPFLPSQLESLNLSWCEISKEGIQYLPTTLTELNISGCTRIGNVGLKLLRERASSLTKVNISFCDIKEE